MNTTLRKFLRDALMTATGISLAPLRAAQGKGIRTDIIKRALSRHFALQTLSHPNSRETVRSRYTNKRFWVHDPAWGEHRNYRQ